MRYSKAVQTEIGNLQLTADDEALLEVKFAERRTEDAPNALLLRAEAQLIEYFSKKRRSFDLPLRAEGTAFQQAVWRAIAEIPYGQTMSYGAVAQKIGKTAAAARAVGAAAGKNPLWIMIPCHRVIAANGALTGYAGGLQRKEYLLHLEAQSVQKQNCQYVQK